ncbi:MAG TPA: hypothetical protein VH107_19090 [Lacipirellulaceae bacterium]|nr:hypothetical protein [Lacipirellulaceae bacterium]
MNADQEQPTVISATSHFSLVAPQSVLTSHVRWGIYLLLIAIAVGNMTGRLLSVNSVDKVQLESARIKDRLASERKQLVADGLTSAQIDARLAADEARLQNDLRLQRPFLSANDRSRWLTIRSLVERGTYEIDSLIAEPTWDTIDMVQHRGRDGEPHLYSSKPPLLATLMAGEYWLINRFSGATLRDDPYEIGRIMLISFNILPLVLMYVLVAQLAERFGTTDWGRIFVVACATLGTFLNTFAIVLNNHVIAAVSAAATIYLFVRIAFDGERRWHYFFLAGLAAAFIAANELPAATLLAFTGLLLLWRAPRQTLLAFTPAVAIVAAAFFGTNWIAHARLSPPYAFRSDRDPADNWYNYTYTVNGREVKSYWLDRKGIDIGEQSKWVYAFHTLVGHHGVFSLTPIWLIAFAGAGMWLVSPECRYRELSALILSVSVICLIFFIGLRPQEDRNYGGMTSGFRWMFWCAPLWLVAMIPAADRLARSTAGQVFAAVLLSFSVLSVSYPTWNPWTHPWLYNWLQWCGWI